MDSEYPIKPLAFDGITTYPLAARKSKVHTGMFGQVLVMRMFRDHGFLTQVCGNNFMVLKVAPPLVVTDAQVDAFVSAIHHVVDLAHSSNIFWSEALGVARRAIDI